MADQGTFRIGLVMAGAISAGAYTAGVIDFLIEALDEWEKARKADFANTPQHRVEIPVITGASAGGMTAALIGSIIRRKLEPVRQPWSDPGSTNPLYDAWVAQVDIRQLLELDDLEQGPAKSILNANALNDIAEKVFKGGEMLAERRPYFSDVVDMFVTVTNLCGVPYAIPMGNAVHGLRLHKDYMHFRLDAEGGVSTADLNADAWKPVVASALASGAFPIGLAAREVPSVAAHYFKRIPNVTDTVPGGGYIGPYTADPFNQDLPITLNCADGGIMDNEPLELAREALAGGPGKHNPREGRDATAAVLMVDPFPDLNPWTEKEACAAPDTTLKSVIGLLIPAMKNQARFKLEELQLAAMENVYSRFLIAPVREVDGATTTSIACGALGGFGGFFDRAFREHDYQLGRRNCQKFLKDHFALPVDNVVMKTWGPADRTPYRIVENGVEFLPIVPLMGTARDEVKAPAWATIDEAKFRKTIAPQIQNRLRELVTNLLDQAGLDGLKKAMGDLLFRMFHDEIVNAALDKVVKSLQDNGQITAGTAPKKTHWVAVPNGHLPPIMKQV